MAISAKRFTGLEEETNTAVADFFTVDNTAILNSANNEVSEITSALKEFIDSANQAIDVDSIMKTASELQAEAADLASGIGSAIEAGTRMVKGAMSEAMNMASMAEAEVEGFVSGISSGLESVIGGTVEGAAALIQAASAMSQLSKTCKKSSGRYGRHGKPYGNQSDCNGRKRKSNKRSACSSNANSLANVLNKLTKGDFKGLFSNLDDVLKSIMALAGMGYDLNMCGVFGALAMGISNNNLLSRASAGLLSGLNSNRNTFGVLDLASSSAGLHTILEKPNAVYDTTRAYTIPNEIRQREYSDFADRSVGALELFDSNWKSSSYDNGLSTSKLNGRSNDFITVMNSRATANVYPTSDLNSAPSDDLGFLNMALQF